MPLAALAAPADSAAQDYGARLILLRPDGFVAWVGDDLNGTDPAAIIALATGA